MQIWSTNQASPVSEIDIKANVCCAKYNPGSSYEIAVGAADHTVLTYDLRKSDSAVHTYRGGLACALAPFLGQQLLGNAVFGDETAFWSQSDMTSPRSLPAFPLSFDVICLSTAEDITTCAFVD